MFSFFDAWKWLEYLIRHTGSIVFSTADFPSSHLQKQLSAAFSIVLHREPMSYYADEKSCEYGDLFDIASKNKSQTDNTFWDFPTFRSSCKVPINEIISVLHGKWGHCIQKSMLFEQDSIQKWFPVRKRLDISRYGSILLVEFFTSVWTVFITK